MPSAIPITPPPCAAITLGARRIIALVSEIGRGARATVYRGVLEADIRRPVAVKLFDLSSCDEPETAIAALGRAAQRSASVLHPNVAQVLDLAVTDDSHGHAVAVIGELVEGATLAHLIESHAREGRRLPLDLALFIATEIAEGLSGAQNATTPDGIATSVAHLDLAAHQVILSNHGEVKLTDFGFAAASRWGSSVRSIRAIAHRAAAMAPEIARGRPGDTRSDVFSLGILLREMLVGPRFPVEMVEAEALGHARSGYVPPAFLELQLPQDVREIIQRALERDPARRFRHATAMAYELRRVALSMGVGDGRIFLRAAVASLVAMNPPSTIAPEDFAPFGEEERTDELDVSDFMPTSAPPRIPSDVPPDRSSGVIARHEIKTNGTDE